MTDATRSKSFPPGIRALALCSALPALVALAACTTASSSRVYSPPAAVTVPNETEVEASLGPTRERLIAALTQEGLVLNQVSGGAAVLLLTLETNQPEAYVDCGRAQHDYTSPRGEAESTTLPLAGSAQYKSAGAAGEPLRISHRAQ
ncbi:MAG: hypothetical protein ACFCUQ_06150, partial [Kiloniellales bacterium]